MLLLSLPTRDHNQVAGRLCPISAAEKQVKIVYLAAAARALNPLAGCGLGDIVMLEMVVLNSLAAFDVRFLVFQAA